MRVKCFLKVGLVAALAIALTWALCRGSMQANLDRSLIEAIKIRRVKVALKVLADGASGEAHEFETPRSFTQIVWHAFRRRRGMASGADSLGLSALQLQCKYSSTYRLEDVDNTDSDADATLVSALLTHGARVNEGKNEWPRCPLWSAIYMSDGALRAVLAHGADTEIRDPIGDTPLICANAEASRILLKYGANTEATAFDGRTALMEAASGYEPEKVRTLLEHHARVDARDKEGKTALDYAMDNTDASHIAIEAILRRHGAR
jgi:hypothetical protein